MKRISLNMGMTAVFIADPQRKDFLRFHQHPMHLHEKAAAKLPRPFIESMLENEIP